MFTSVGRRLALLNAIVVIVVLAVVSAAVFFLLERNLQNEVDSALEDRAVAAQVTWASLFAGPSSSQDDGQTIATLRSDSDDTDDGSESDEAGEEREDDDKSEELIQSGDTIAYALDRAGQILADARGVPLAGLPNLAVMPAVLSGDHVFTDMTIAGNRVRVYTEPVRVGGEIAGAIQVAQGQREYEAALRVVRLATIGGLLLGALIAIPAGFFLAGRSMKPIHAAFERQRAFVADASHELRTPLAVMRAQAEYLQRMPEPDPEVVSAGHQSLISEIDSMSRLVNDLLLLARADSASLALDKQDLDLTALAQSAVSSFAQTAQNAGVQLTVEAPAVVQGHADRERLLQVLRILLDNAIAHTPGGGSVTVSVERRVGRPVLAIQDTGTGIAPEDLAHIFDRFYRADQGRGRDSGGAGLGLAIARTLVEAHGGTIEAMSSPGSGSTFVISLLH